MNYSWNPFVYFIKMILFTLDISDRVTMFDSLSSKGPKLVYSHTRQGGPPEGKLSEKTTSTPISAGLTNPTTLQSHAIPRPSVTVVAQTRKPSKEEHSQRAYLEEVLPSNGNSSEMTAVSVNALADGTTPTNNQRQINHYYQQLEPDPAEVYENYNHTEIGPNGPAHKSDPGPLTASASKRGILKPVSIHIERVDSLDNNNNTDNIRAEFNASPSSVMSEPFNSSGYHGGYRVYRGKVYEITREIPIILTDSSTPIRLSSSTTTPSTPNGKPAHSSTATASVFKSALPMNGQLPNNHTLLSDKSQQQPRALPSPKLNGKVSNGVVQPSVTSSEFNSKQLHDQLQPYQQSQLFREHRRQSDDSRFSDGPELITYIGGVQSMRRPNTVSDKKSIRELSPHTWGVRGRNGSPSSLGTVSTARRLSPQRSASATRTLPLRNTGGQIWTVVTKSPPHSPRQRSSSVTGQHVVTRASYRLDPNLSTKLQSSSTSSNQPPKSILKTTTSSPTPTASVISSGKTEQYDNHPFPGDQMPSTSSSHLLPRPRATLAYTDFDFSSLPHQQSHGQLTKNPKRNVQQTNSLPIHQHKGKSHGNQSNTLTRRPATAGAALQKNGTMGSKGSQPQKKSVTFNSQVRLHVDSNVSTMRSLSIDS